jgi:hypothetical protein
MIQPQQLIAHEFPSGLWFFDSQMRFGFSRLGSDQATAKNLGYDCGGIARAIDAKVRELVGSQTLGMKGTEAGFVAKKRPACHGHAAREKDVNGGIEPDDRYGGVTKEFGSPRLGVGAAAQSKNRRLLELSGAADRSPQLLGFELAKCGLAMTLEKLGNGYACGVFDALVKIDEVPAELTCQAGADRAFTCAHETGQAYYL